MKWIAAIFLITTAAVAQQTHNQYEPPNAVGAGQKLLAQFVGDWDVVKTARACQRSRLGQSRGLSGFGLRPRTPSASLNQRRMSAFSGLRRSIRDNHSCFDFSRSSSFSSSLAI
jgi:hypothetical protein